MKIFIDFSSSRIIYRASHSRGDSREMSNKARERERRLARGANGACNINPFNKLIIDEIYRAFTVRGGGANALHLSRGNPGYISGLAPLRLDLRARANEPQPASATKRRCTTMLQQQQQQQHSNATWEALRLRRSTRVMGVAKKNLYSPRWHKRRESKEHRLGVHSI